MKQIWMSAILVLGVGYAATIPYQGLATDAKNNSKADSSYAVGFALYSDSIGGTALWNESQNIATKNGLLSTTLGLITTIPDNLFHGSALYLSVSFDGGSEGTRVLLGTTPWATAAGKSGSSGFADSAGKAAGLNDSVAALRSIFASQMDSMKALRDAMAAQGAAIVSKDRVGKAHVADSAKVTAGLNDSVRALRLAIDDSTRCLRNGLADTILTLCSNALGDSVHFVRANVHDTADGLQVRIKDTSLALRATIVDSAASYRAGLTNSAKALRDTAANLRKALFKLNATANTRARAIASLASRVDALLTLLSSLNHGSAWNTAVSYGYLKDSRDGQGYLTVLIGSQTWMAQNLSYRNVTGSTDTVGVCYNNSSDSCAKYGRLYTWAEVMQGASSSRASPSGVKGVCPAGWHVPSDTEWTTMLHVVDTANTVDGKMLKSTNGWATNTGTDSYGFRALPGGDFGGASFSDVGSSGYWWSASERNATSAWRRYMSYGLDFVRGYNYDKTDRYSLRCLKD